MVLNFIIAIATVTALSALCLFLLNVLLIYHREYSSTAGKVILTFSICLMIFYILYTVVYLDFIENIPHLLCRIIAVLSHFISFASQMWKTVLAYDLYRSVSRMESNTPDLIISSSRYRNYSIFAWLVVIALWLPAVIVSYLELVPEYYMPWFGGAYCVLSNEVAIGIFKEAPALCIILIDCVLLVLTVRSIKRIKAMAKSNDIKLHTNRFHLYVKLILVMGVSQITYFLHFIHEHLYLRVAINLYNGVYGVFIALIFGWKFFPRKDTKCPCISCFRVKRKSSETSQETPPESSVPAENETIGL